MNKEQIEKAQNYLDSRQFNGLSVAEIMVEFSALSQPTADLDELRTKFFNTNSHDVNNYDIWNFFLPHLQKPVESEWISVEDRLPELGDEYNVVYDLEDGEPPLTTTMEFNAINKTWIDVIGARTDKTDVILFWKPLPSPPIQTK
jgi:hypothetical protein